MPKVISVVAGGWSVKQVRLANIPGHIIAVNDSALHLPKVDTVFTMDRRWMENRWDWLKAHKLPFYQRQKYLDSEQRWTQWIHGYENDNTRARFGETEDELHGPNSGHCALNLAYVRRPAAVYLFGFDMCLGPRGERHWYPDYSWRPGGKGQAGKSALRDWAQDLDEASICFRAAGIDVYNVSERSIVKSFQRISPLDLGILNSDGRDTE